jgi:hypothetical protein
MDLSSSRQAIRATAADINKQAAESIQSYLPKLPISAHNSRAEAGAPSKLVALSGAAQQFRGSWMPWLSGLAVILFVLL